MSDYAIRPAMRADLEACARLVADLGGRPLEHHRRRLELDLSEPERSHLLVATAAADPATVIASGRVSRFTPAPDAPAFTGLDNQASLALHAELGFTEVTRDFSFPGAPPELAGVLCRLAPDPRDRRA